VSLDFHDGEWQDAVEELRELGLIGSGGRLILHEPRAFFNGQGFYFTPLGRQTPARDIVMAGELNFSSGGDDYEECSLLARVENPGGRSVSTYLQVGIDNDEDVFYYDTEGADSSAIYDFQKLGFDLGEPHHILFILADNTLTVYFDGQLLFDHEEVNEERTGSFGVALMGSDRASRCEGLNVWVYDAPAYDPGVCEVTTDGAVNQSTGPSTNFAIAGSFRRGMMLHAIGQTTGADGFTWWELEDNSWVRDDVVNAVGDCASVPESE
jgi:hypothetical protein